MESGDATGATSPGNGEEPGEEEPVPPHLRLTLHTYDTRWNHLSCRVLPPEEAIAWVKQREREREASRAQMPEGATLPTRIVTTYTYDASGAILRCRRGPAGQEPASDN